MPRIGGRKLLHLIQPGLPEELYLGRDAFFEFLREGNLLIGKRRYRTRTTFSNHWLKKYPNLIKYFKPDRANQLWVSDITYIVTAEGFGYLSLITDGYSRKIIGWALGDDPKSEHTVKALKMAILQLPKGTKNLYHHSDRGVQYCCEGYVKILKKKHIQISMTENGDPLENAIAERVNGILKEEWLTRMKIATRSEARNQLERIIKVYNEVRPHSSLDMKTPQVAHQMEGKFKMRWKNYYKSQTDKKGKEKINSFIAPNEAMATR